MVRRSDTATCRVRSACGPIPQPMVLSGHVVRKHPARGLRDGDVPRLPPAASNHGVGAPGLTVILRSRSRPGKSAPPVPPVPRGLRPQGPFCNLFICMALPRMYCEPAVPGPRAVAQLAVPRSGAVDPPADGESTLPVLPCGTPSRHMGAGHRGVHRRQPLCQGSRDAPAKPAGGAPFLLGALLPRITRRAPPQNLKISRTRTAFSQSVLALFLSGSP